MMGLLGVPLMTDMLQNLQDSFTTNFGQVNDWMSRVNVHCLLLLSHVHDLTLKLSLYLIPHTHTQAHTRLPTYVASV